jgi:hypothetical protein
MYHFFERGAVVELVDQGTAEIVLERPVRVSRSRDADAAGLRVVLDVTEVTDVTDSSTPWTARSPLTPTRDRIEPHRARR